MSGILNQKQRLFDTIVTLEGRKQLAAGKLKAKFYAFTDAGMHYSQETIVSGGLDETDRIQLEATNLPQDTISIEADDSGMLTGFPLSGSTKFIFRGGQILSSSNNGRTITRVSSSAFISLGEHLLKSSADNFSKQYILRSPDILDPENLNFVIGPTAITHSITNKKPFNKKDITTIDVTKADSFFQDRRLSHIPNYAFLPPVNRPRLGTTEATLLGEYVSINQNPILSFKDLSKELNKLEANGYMNIINFTETSKQSNIFAQFFEVGQSEMSKLDVIDFGSFPTENGKNQHVFFVGKVYNDDNGADTFINLFTIIYY